MSLSKDEAGRGVDKWDASILFLQYRSFILRQAQDEASNKLRKRLRYWFILRQALDERLRSRQSFDRLRVGLRYRHNSRQARSLTSSG